MRILEAINIQSRCVIIARNDSLITRARTWPYAVVRLLNADLNHITKLVLLKFIYCKKLRVWTVMCMNCTQRDKQHTIFQISSFITCEMNCIPCIEQHQNRICLHEKEYTTPVGPVVSESATRLKRLSGECREFKVWVNYLLSVLQHRINHKR